MYPLHLLVLLLDLGGDRRHQLPRLPRLLPVLPLGVLQRRARLPQNRLDDVAAAVATALAEERRREGLGLGGGERRRGRQRGDGGGDEMYSNVRRK